MKLEVGKYYRTRDGRKVGPVGFRSGRSYPYFANVGQYGNQEYTRDGRWHTDYEAPHDLIAEWADEPAAPQPAGPVRMVQVKKIVDGAYGTVVVSDKGRLVRAKYMSDAATIRAAIATLSEIADAMEENSK